MDHLEAATCDANGRPSDPQLQSEDPEIMALLFNTTGQSSELPTIHWQDHGIAASCYNSYDTYNPSLCQCPPSFGDYNGANQYGGADGCYSFYGDLNEPHGVATSNGSACMPMDFFVMEEKNSAEESRKEPSGLGEETGSAPHQKSLKKRKNLWGEFDQEPADVREDQQFNGSSKKKSNAPKNGSKGVQQSKKAKKGATKANESEECDNICARQTSTSSSSDDDSATSHEINGGLGPCPSSKAASGVTTDSNPKTRALHGSATDPQSLYARKRRERINERLRILQKLVPNGTKVDISTMLEEAVQYVKFLQLQIKLLSSDDLWMYAPIAYNGKDIGLDIKLADFGGRC